MNTRVSVSAVVVGCGVAEAMNTERKGTPNSISNKSNQSQSTQDTCDSLGQLLDEQFKKLDDQQKLTKNETRFWNSSQNNPQIQQEARQHMKGAYTAVQAMDRLHLEIMKKRQQQKQDQQYKRGLPTRRNKLTNFFKDLEQGQQMSRKIQQKKKKKFRKTRKCDYPSNFGLNVHNQKKDTLIYRDQAYATNFKGTEFKNFYGKGKTYANKYSSKFQKALVHKQNSEAHKTMLNSFKKKVAIIKEKLDDLNINITTKWTKLYEKLDEDFKKVETEKLSRVDRQSYNAMQRYLHEIQISIYKFQDFVPVSSSTQDDRNVKYYLLTFAFRAKKYLSYLQHDLQKNRHREKDYNHYENMWKTLCGSSFAHDLKRGLQLWSGVAKQCDQLMMYIDTQNFQKEQNKKEMRKLSKQHLNSTKTFVQNNYRTFYNDKQKDMNPTFLEKSRELIRDHIQSGHQQKRLQRQEARNQRRRDTGRRSLRGF